MNATLEHMAADASFVVAQAFRTHIIVPNAQGWKRIETGVQKS